MTPHDLAQAADGETLTMTRRFPASRERLYAAFTEPKELARWWGPEGMDAPIVELDLREGGTWRTCMRNQEGGLHCVGGRYIEVTPPERLVMTWAWEGGDIAGLETTVTLEFLAQDEGSELRLTHSGLPGAEWAAKHEGGWGSTFTCLERTLAEPAAT